MLADLDLVSRCVPCGLPLPSGPVHRSVHGAVASTPGCGGAARSVEFMLDPLTLPPLPTLQGERVILREPRDCDVDDRLRHPIDPEEEDGYGSSWRQEWDGRR